ncbi:MAG TPA: N-acetylmuramoyl-L-alanine amidase [Sphingomicrobium sp.]|nr:N-acetylmuramoyl-L-alanine amidase [Sphingomicrobium sp.]
MLGAGRGGAAASEGTHRAEIGEARRSSVTVRIAPAVDVVVSGGRAAGRPIVVIDPGHGGRDPGAVSVSGAVAEKQLTLALARELRDRLVERGRVRVALTRDSDRYLSLEERAGVARGLGASLFLSLHMDSAPNPLARGASVYSLSDVASDAEAARFAAAENAGGVAGAADGSVRSMLSDLALRSLMSASADLAARLVRKSAARVEMRPEPHRFATFHVLRRAEAPAVLFEAGYVSNADDELLLRSPEHRAALVAGLAETIEADVAARSRR